MKVSELKSSNSEEVTKENNTESSLAEATRKIDILEAEVWIFHCNLVHSTFFLPSSINSRTEIIVHNVMIYHS